jgi:peptidoglycan/xylan/chitin deacetylase (PgdA/CDA1 family)
MTLYVPTDYPDGNGELWWLALEEIVARAQDEIELCRDGTLWRLPTATVADKYRSFEQIYWWLRAIDKATQRQVVRVLADRYDVDMAAECRRLIMDWDEIRALAADPLVTIAAHTKSHFAVAKLSTERACEEMAGSADRIERELGAGRSTSLILMAMRRARESATSFLPANAASRRRSRRERACYFRRRALTSCRCHACR